jgi:mRNA deadenylase 3'-5' endonuclease subunit Ccr4
MKQTLLSWNINYSTQTVGEYEIYNWKHRAPQVLKFLIEHIPNTILCLQEATEESIADIEKILPNHQIFTKKVHPAGRYLLTAFPHGLTAFPIKLKVEQDTRECWDCFNVRINDDHLLPGENELLITNVHLPMSATYRLPLTAHIAAQTGDYATYHNILSIVAGDFNTFPDDQGYEQTMSMQTGAYREATSVIVAANDPKLRILETFSPYPYDIVPDAPNKYKYHLDHIFVTGDIQNSIPECFVSSASDHYALRMRF